MTWLTPVRKACFYWMGPSQPWLTRLATVRSTRITKKWWFTSSYVRDSFRFTWLKGASLVGRTTFLVAFGDWNVGTSNHRQWVQIMREEYCCVFPPLHTYIQQRYQLYVLQLFVVVMSSERIILRNPNSKHHPLIAGTSWVVAKVIPMTNLKRYMLTLARSEKPSPERQAYPNSVLFYPLSSELFPSADTTEWTEQSGMKGGEK